MHPKKQITLCFITLMLCIFTVQANAGQITGRITAKDTGYGIESASVSLNNGTTETNVQTDPFGYYQIRDVAAGTYSIKASHPAYHAANESNIVVGADDRMKKSYELVPIQPGAKIFDIYGQVSCVVSGLMLKNVPIKVTVTNNDAQLIKQEVKKTDSSGFAQFSGMQKGQYFFSINKDELGFPKIPGWESYTPSESKLLESDHMLNMRLKPEERTLTVTVMGYNPVTQENNVPLEGIIVEATAVDPDNPDHELLPPDICG